MFFRNFQKLFPKMLAVEHSIVEQGDNHQKVAWQMEAESFLRKMTGALQRGRRRSTSIPMAAFAWPSPTGNRPRWPTS